MNLYDSRVIETENVVKRLQGRINFLTAKSNKFSTTRLLVFISGMIITIAAFIISKEIGWIFSILSIAAFSITVHLHNKLLMGIRRAFVYLKIKLENKARMNIDWEKIPLPVINIPSDEQSLGKDLDLFGSRSLQHLTDLAVSYEGSDLLRKWISNKTADHKTISERQNIIKELSAETRYRDKFLLKAYMISKNPLQCAKILNWIGKSSDVKIPGWLLPVSSVLILIYTTLFILNVIDIAGPVWFGIFLLYFFLYSSYQKKIGMIVEEASTLESQFKKFSLLIIYTGTFSFENSPNLKKFLDPLAGKDTNVKLKSLQKIITALLIRE
ncbi:MAG: hypothetical protein ABIY50_01600, partial [Ignavibacteria bacterium]